MSFFTVKNYSDEFLEAMSAKTVKPIFTSTEEEDETVAATADDIIESTKDYILKELGMSLDEFKQGFKIYDYLEVASHLIDYYLQTKHPDILLEYYESLCDM